MNDLAAAIAKAQTASMKASDRLIAANQKLSRDCLEYRRKREKPVETARVAARDAIAAVTKLELAQAGLVPGETIVRYQGALWRLRVKATGHAELDPMTKEGRPHMGRYAKPAPYRLSDLTITDLKVKHD